jgi:hypothetical protein
VPDKQNRAIAALGAATALAWLLLFTQGGGAWQLHQAASLWPAATIFPAAAAAALAFAESRRVRAATVPLGVAALVLAFVASPQFVDAFVRDSFITPGRPPELRLTTIDDRPSKQVSLAFVPMDIRISPSGEYMAALTEDDTEVTTVRVGRADGALAIFQADDAIFVGDDRVLLLQRGAGGSVVRVVSLRDGVKDERAPVALDGFQAARVSVSLSGDRWVALGSGADRSLMTLTGRFDGSTPTERQWAADGGYSNSIVAASDDRVLLLQTRYRPNILARSGFYQWAFLLGPYSTESQLSMVDAQGVRTPVAASELSVTCDGRGGLAETTCAAYDGACTRILGFDSVTATFKPLAIFKGHLFTRHVSADGWIAGWWGGSAVAIHPRSYEAVRVGSGFAAYAIAASGRAIAAASVSGSGSLIQIFTHSEASARR